MAAADPQSMLIDEIQAQIEGIGLTGLHATDRIIASEYPRKDVHWPRDVVIVKWAGASVDVADNESDFVRHSIEVVLSTKGDNEETLGQTLMLWVRQIRLTIADRASDRSPLRTDPLPLTSHNLGAINAAVQSVVIGAPQTTSTERDGAFRVGALLPITITTYERAT